MIAAAGSPSPLWFATRAAGTTTLLVLTVTVVLGIATSLRWDSPRTPRFVTAAMHRNLSLFALLLLVVHVVTAVVDPFAGIHALDAVVPFAGAYRTVWLGLGVLAAEVMLAVALTSAVRRRIGPRAWRAVHWTAYASWPLAVVHGLGTGSDSQAPWLIGITAACTAAVLLALAQRLLRGTWRSLPVRVAAAAVSAIVVLAASGWAVAGPFQPGWAAKAGTPASILDGAPARPPAVHHSAAPFSDALVGVGTPSAAGVSFSLRDTVDTSLTVELLPPGPSQMSPTLVVERNGRTLCDTPARMSNVAYAVCGTTRVVVQLFGSVTSVTGTITTSGPL